MKARYKALLASLAEAKIVLGTMVNNGRPGGMVTLVEEPVDVSAVFRGGKLRPMAFMWRKRSYKVERVLGSYRSMKGRYLEIYYSVMSDTPEVYELRFSTA
jgi:hypothetical protein